MAHDKIVDLYTDVLPEDAHWDEFEEAVNGGEFSPLATRFFKTVIKDQGGYDFPAQAISASLLETSSFEVSPAMKQAIGRLSNSMVDTGTITGEAVSTSDRSIIRDLGDLVGGKKASDTGLGRYAKIGLMTKWFGNPFQTALQFAEEVPVLRDIVLSNSKVAAESERYTRELLDNFYTKDASGNPIALTGLDPKKLTVEQQQTKNAVDFIEETPGANRALSDILLEQNKEGKIIDDLTTIPRYNSLSAEGKAHVGRMKDLIQASYMKSANLIVSTNNFKSAKTIGKVLMAANQGMNWQDSLNLGINMHKVLQGNVQDGISPVEVKTNNRGQIVNFDEAFTEANRRLVANGLGGNLDYQSALKVAIEIQPSKVKLATELLSRPYFSSERRIGRYIIKYQVGVDEKTGKPIFATEGAVDIPSLKAKRARVQKETGLAPEQITTLDKTKDREADNFGLFDSRIVNRYKDLETKEFEAVMKHIGDPELAERIRQEYVPGAKTLEIVQKEGTKDYLKPQKQVAGREHLNMWESAVGYYSSIAKGAAFDRAKAQNELMFEDQTIKLEDNVEIRKVMRDYADTMTTPNGSDFKGARKAVFSYWLGFNLSSSLIEMTQPLLTLMPELTSRGGFTDMRKTMSDTVGMLTKAYKRRGVAGKLDFEDAEFNQLFQRAQDEGVVQYGSLLDIFSTEDNDFINQRRLAAGQKGNTLKRNADTAMNKYFQGSKALYSITSSMGAKTSFVSGLVTGRKKGLKGSELYDYALELTRSTTFSGGEANRPLGFNKLKPGGQVAGVAG
ncbi:MAG: hypothetical protein ACXABY_27115, partial [Candidatus Thorarchaeota archaeon]